MPGVLIIIELIEECMRLLSFQNFSMMVHMKIPFKKMLKCIILFYSSVNANN